MKLIPLPAFEDNYIWLLHNGSHALVVDPGDAQVVQDALSRLNLKLDAILLTHHHGDHTGGVDELRDATGAQVFGPLNEDMPEPLLRVQDGGFCGALGLPFSVLEVPGHTRGHIAYYCDKVSLESHDSDGQDEGILFCGDTLFSGGCGRLFEGTPAQMLASLDKLSALPQSTLVCSAHEYTLSNLKFAQAVEPDNQLLAEYIKHCQALRNNQIPTLPSSIGVERDINPFLRSREATVRQTVQNHTQQTITDDVQAFALLREWKNVYR